MEGGNEAARTRHISRSKLPPRECTSQPLNPASSFLEIGLFASSAMHADDMPSEGPIVGIGRVVGRNCMIVCNDARMEGQAYLPLTIEKHPRTQESTA